MSKQLSRDLTSYDFIKCFAVLLMIVDHVGYYFYPEDNWWRAFGRLCVPVWFFLIGYARSRDIGPRLWVAMGILVAANMVAGMSVFPLNIMGSMLAVRMLLRPLIGVMMRGRFYFWGIYTILGLLILPTHNVTEYGTLGIIMALYGYLCRHQEEMFEPALLNQYFLVTLVVFVVTQCIYFGFDENQMILVAVGSLAVMGGLFFFRPASFPGLTARLPGAAAGLVRLGGRRTLEIYVVHLLLFKGLAMALSPAYYQPLQWTWLPHPPPTPAGESSSP